MKNTPCLRRLALLLVCLLPSLLSAGAKTAAGLPAPASELLNRFWPAHWIKHTSTPQSDFGVWLFRRTFELAEKPSGFVVHVTADARYRLWVNGHNVVAGPQVGDPDNWHFDSIDLAPWLRAGKNVIAARVIGYGDIGPHAIMSQRTAFLLQGDTAAERVVDTGTAWKVARDTSYGAFLGDRNSLRTYLVVSPGLSVTGARHPWGWETPEFDDSSWAAAQSLRPGYPHGVGTDVDYWLKPRSIPLLEEVSERFARVVRASGVTPPAAFPAQAAAFTVPANTKAAILLDRGHLTNAYPQLTVSGGNGASLTMRYAEALFDEKRQKGNRNETDGKELNGIGDRFMPDGAKNRRFSPIDFRTYRYLQLDIETGDEPVVIEDLDGVFTAYPFKENARFESDDPQLARIWDVGWRTARLCAIDTYVDCPYYEQLQYVGDTRLQALISLYVSGDDRLMRNAIEQFDRSRIAEGLTRSRYPANHPQLINTFSLFWVDMVHDHWWHRGDTAFMAERLPGVQAVLAWFERRMDPATGLLGPLDYWTFVDWAREWPWEPLATIGGQPPGAQTGGSTVVSLQYATTLRRAAELARALGQTDLAARYEERAAGLVAAVNRLCWNQERQFYADTPGGQSFSQHSNLLAVLTGAVTGDAARDLIQRTADDETLVQTTTYFRFYLLRALKQAGLGDQYLSRLGLWHDMLARGLTTFAERPDPTRSDCHAWSATPIYEFLATVCGIEPATPGFTTVRIEPHLGHLKHATATMPHPRGEITVALRRTDSGLHAEVALPDGVTGEFAWGGRTVALRAGAQTLTLP